MATFRLSSRHRQEDRRSRIARRQLERSLSGWTPEPVRIFGRRQQEVIARLVARDGDGCYLCGAKLDRGQYHIEHIIPRARGGTNDDANLAIACVPCNYRKGDKIVSITIAERMPCFSQ